MTPTIDPTNVSAATRAEARRWLDGNVGRTLYTVQVLASTGSAWEPGDRVLTKTGAATWALDGSEVRLTTAHRIAALTDTSLALAWYDEDGARIHTTVYTVVR